MKQATILFLGTQGSGKGTQAQLLKDHLAKQDPERDLIHFEMGKNLRALAAEEGYTARLTNEILSRGELIPFVISTSVFSQYLMEHVKTGTEHLFIDGFPRTLDQTPNIQSAMRFYKRENPTVLYITIPDEVAVERLMKRGREDDTPEGIRERLRWSQEEGAPVCAWFKENPEFRFLEIDGNRTIEEIHADILAQLHL